MHKQSCGLIGLSVNSGLSVEMISYFEKNKKTVHWFHLGIVSKFLILREFKRID